MSTTVQWGLGTPAGKTEEATQIKKGGLLYTGERQGKHHAMENCVTMTSTGNFLFVQGGKVLYDSFHVECLVQ